MKLHALKWRGTCDQPCAVACCKHHHHHRSGQGAQTPNTTYRWPREGSPHAAATGDRRAGSTPHVSACAQQRPTSRLGSLLQLGRPVPHQSLGEFHRELRIVAHKRGEVGLAHVETLGVICDLPLEPCGQFGVAETCRLARPRVPPPLPRGLVMALHTGAEVDPVPVLAVVLLVHQPTRLSIIVSKQDLVVKVNLGGADCS
mmetsp:Transcript_24745/g.67947  ORF Transcript_24745/g.67947 Transcript_24745/m.67947 type:complete len:201 (+) Transcript_24745:108-710(+)